MIIPMDLLFMFLWAVSLLVLSFKITKTDLQIEELSRQIEVLNERTSSYKGESK